MANEDDSAAKKVAVALPCSIALAYFIGMGIWLLKLTLEGRRIVEVYQGDRPNGGQEGVDLELGEIRREPEGEQRQHETQDDQSEAAESEHTHPAIPPLTLTERSGEDRQWRRGLPRSLGMTQLPIIRSPDASPVRRTTSDPNNPEYQHGSPNSSENPTFEGTEGWSNNAVVDGSGTSDEDRATVRFQLPGEPTGARKGSNNKGKGRRVPRYEDLPPLPNTASTNAMKPAPLRIVKKRQSDAGPSSPLQRSLSTNDTVSQLDDASVFDDESSILASTPGPSRPLPGGRAPVTPPYKGKGKAVARKVTPTKQDLGSPSKAGGAATTSYPPPARSARYATHSRNRSRHLSDSSMTIRSVESGASSSFEQGNAGPPGHNRPVVVDDDDDDDNNDKRSSLVLCEEATNDLAAMVNDMQDDGSSSRNNNDEEANEVDDIYDKPLTLKGGFSTPTAIRRAAIRAASARADPPPSPTPAPRASTSSAAAPPASPASSAASSATMTSTPAAAGSPSAAPRPRMHCPEDGLLLDFSTGPECGRVRNQPDPTDWPPDAVARASALLAAGRPISEALIPPAFGAARAPAPAAAPTAAPTATATARPPANTENTSAEQDEQDESSESRSTRNHTRRNNSRLPFHEPKK